MTPLSDRSVIVLVTATLGLVFALVFWFVRLQPAVDPPLLWRDPPAREAAPARPLQPDGTVL
jgi:hypothetical protein